MEHILLKLGTLVQWTFYNNSLWDTYTKTQYNVLVDIVLNWSGVYKSEHSQSIFNLDKIVSLKNDFKFGFHLRRICTFCLHNW